MLLRTLKAGADIVRRSFRRGPPVPIEFPYELERRIGQLHARAPVGRHLEILLGDARIGNEPFPELYRRCLKDTGTEVTPFNVFQRFTGRLNLVRYFLAGLDIAGARGEVGVYRGATALLLCRAARTRQADFDGQGFFLIDSFMGASPAADEDLIAVRQPTGSIGHEAFFNQGAGAIGADTVRAHFGAFPRVSIVQGWVPEVLSILPQLGWAFLHLDVNLYQPTLSALEYFWPRLAVGGVIVSDDFGSPFTPGARRAWHAFSSRHEVPFVVLGERQAVILKV